MNSKPPRQIEVNKKLELELSELTLKQLFYIKKYIGLKTLSK